MIVIVIMVSRKVVILIFNMKSSSGWMTTATITLVFTLGYQVHIWQFQVHMPCMCDTKGRHHLYLKKQQLFDLTRGQLYVCLLHKRSKYWHKSPQENFIYLSSWALTTGLASSCHALSEWCGKQKNSRIFLYHCNQNIHQGDAPRQTDQRNTSTENDPAVWILVNHHFHHKLFRWKDNLSNCPKSNKGAETWNLLLIWRHLTASLSR